MDRLLSHTVPVAMAVHRPQAEQVVKATTEHSGKAATAFIVHPVTQVQEAAVGMAEADRIRTAPAMMIVVEAVVLVMSTHQVQLETIHPDACLTRPIT